MWFGPTPVSYHYRDLSKDVFRGGLPQTVQPRALDRHHQRVFGAGESVRAAKDQQVHERKKQGKQKHGAAVPGETRVLSRCSIELYVVQC